MPRSPLGFVALSLTVLTGGSGLIYEIVWQRYLAILLGSQAESVASVLGIFLGCLALGYALFGRVARRISGRPAATRGQLLSSYALVEAGIGIYAWLFPLLFSLARNLAFRDSPIEGFALDFLISAALIGPPAVLMGATVPILTQALPPDLGHATRVHAWVYGLNTLGAFVGALGAGFVILPRLGLDGSMLLAGSINLLCGAGFMWLGRREAASALPQSAAAAPGPLRLAAGLALAAALLGFAMMAMQIVLNRLGALSFGSSEFTFCIVVAVFVLSIAGGSLLVSALPRVPSAVVCGAAWLLALSFLLLQPEWQNAPYWAHVLRTHFGSTPGDFYAYHLASLVALLLVLGVPVGLSGAMLPLLFHEIRRSFGELGQRAGRLYAWNTVGSLLGALLAGYVLPHWIDLEDVYRVAAAALVLAATLVTLQVASPRLRAPAAGLALALLGITLALPGWDPSRLASGLFREREPLEGTGQGPARFFALPSNRQSIVFYRDDPTTSVAVAESARADGRPDRSLLVNGKSDGLLIGEYATRALNGIIPALFADRCERAFVVGYGTGVSAAELAALSSKPLVDVAEISSGVLGAAPFFDYANLGASRNDRIRVLRTDAFRVLTRSGVDFDVIVSEPSNPWVTGVEMLYSQEFYELARSRLAPGGVFGQWIHTYELDSPTLALVLRTYASVFGHVAVWYTTAGDLLLLGARDAGLLLDAGRLERRAERPDFAAALRRASVRGHPGLLAHELLPAGVLDRSWVGEIHTLRHPILSQRAAKAFFRNDVARLPLVLAPPASDRGVRNSLLGRALASTGPATDWAFWRPLLEEACANQPLECATLVARARVSAPASADLAGFLDGARKNPELAGVLAPEVLARLAQLFGKRGGETKPVSADEARERTLLYVNGYVYGAPFERAALAELWNHCADEPDACRAGRERTEEVVGKLSP